MPFLSVGGSGGGGGAVTFTEEEQTKFDAEVAIAISLAPAGVGLPNGDARASAAIDNSVLRRRQAMIYLAIMSGGTAPTAGAVYEAYLLQRNAAGTVATDGWGGVDAAITILNAPLIGTIAVTATINTVFRGIFATPWDLPLGPSWGIAIKNASGQSLNNTEGNHLKLRAMFLPLLVPA